MEALPERAIILARISDARRAAEDRKDTRGVDGQVSDLRSYAALLGWAIGPDNTHVIIENDTSAYRRRTCIMPDGRKVVRPYRPEFWRACEMIRTGTADGFLCLDLDRCVRDPLDLEDIAHAVQLTDAPVASITGTFKLASSDDLSTSRILVAVANKSSADTARRVRRGRVKVAERGTFGGGPRSYGLRYGPARGTLIVDEHEATVIRWMADQVLRDISLRSIAAKLRADGELSSKGGQFTAQTVRNILLNPAICGKSRYRPIPKPGQPKTLMYRVTSDDMIVGDTAWPAILDYGVWKAVRAKLTDPGRTTSPGPEPRWLVSLIATCGVCQGPVTVRSSRKNHPIYRCPDGHVERSALDIDRLVELIVVGRLSQPDLAPDSPAVDTSALRQRAAALRELLNEQARLHAQGVIDTEQLAEGSRSLRGQLDAVEAQLGTSAGVPLLHGTTGPDAAAKWARLSPGHKKKIVARLVSVEILPLPPGEFGKREFDPRFVRITRK